MDRKGTLTIRSYSKRLDRVIYSRTGDIASGEYSLLEVSDTGCGMDAKTLSKAFEPFFTTKAVGEGTGMGLSVVLGIAESHGGGIQVESTVGTGTTLRIYLPIAEESVSGSEDEDEGVRVSGTERILFVDDEQMLVEMAENELSNLGFKVTGISDSGHVLTFLKNDTTRIDILVTDQTMPGMSGIELAKEALKIRNNLPIILCTGYNSEISPERATTIGISLVMMKPYRSNELSKAIRDVIDNTHEGTDHGKNTRHR
jgi:CheY-like chemotaxis protein